MVAQASNHLFLKGGDGHRLVENGLLWELEEEAPTKKHVLTVAAYTPTPDRNGLHANKLSPADPIPVRNVLAQSYQQRTQNRKNHIFQPLRYVRYRCTYRPAFLVVPPPDPATCKGAIIYCSWQSNAPVQEDVLHRRGLKTLFETLSNEQNLAVIVFNSTDGWGKFLPHINEVNMSPEKANEVRWYFKTFATRWQRQLLQVCQERGIPEPSKSDWYLGAESDGAKHMAQLFPHLPAGYFKAAWIHGATHFPNFPETLKNDDFLFGLGSRDYGMNNTYQHYEACLKSGFKNVVIRPEERVRHSALSVSYLYALQYFQWIAAGKPRGSQIYYADIVNMDLYSRKQDWLPENQTVKLFDTQLAEKFFPGRPLPE